MILKNGETYTVKIEEKVVKNIKLRYHAEVIQDFLILPNKNLSHNACIKLIEMYSSEQTNKLK